MARRKTTKKAAEGINPIQLGFCLINTVEAAKHEILKLIPHIGDEVRIEEKYVTDRLSIYNTKGEPYRLGGLKRTDTDKYSVLGWKDGEMHEVDNFGSLSVLIALMMYYDLKRADEA